VILRNQVALVGRPFCRCRAAVSELATPMVIAQNIYGLSAFASKEQEK
jgi:hypothetical protein